MKAKQQKIRGWGNYPVIKSQVYRPESLKQLQAIGKNTKKILAFGNNMSYGDASLSEETIDMKRLNKVLEFDKEKGICKAEAGILLSEILQIIIPYGWFVHVTPGTKFVTIGGCVASNIHGKNHHKYGNFSNCVKSFDIILASGELVHCTKEKNRDLFEATCGGMGLTGIIYSVEIELKKIESPFIEVTYTKCKNIDEVFKELEEKDKTHEYTVAWIDCLAKGNKLGRGIVMSGNHVKEKQPLKVHSKKRINIPFNFPNIMLNKWSVKLLNALYYAMHKSTRKRVHYDKFFYPLDNLHNWNRMYGKRGFIQYQFVLPIEVSEKNIKQILKIISGYGRASFLSVLKKFKNDDRLLSFTKEGYTLALDIPLDKKTRQMAKELDEIIINNKGRIYLTKDSLMDAETFKKLYPQIDEWKAIKKKYDPETKFVSLEAKRVGLI